MAMMKRCASLRLRVRPLSKRMAHAQRILGRRAPARVRFVSHQLDWVEMLTGERREILRTAAPATRRRKRRKRARLKGGQKGAFIPRVGETKNLPLVIRTSNRKIAFRERLPEEEPGNHVFASLSDEGMQRLHYVLLISSLRSLKEHAEVGSARSAEVWAWVERTGHDEPFAFDTCVLLAAALSIDPAFRNPFPDTWELDEEGRPTVLRRGVDIDFAGASPEDVRELCRAILRRSKTGVPQHARILRDRLIDAEYGNSDARRWIAGESSATPNYRECLEALGFASAAERDASPSAVTPSRTQGRSVSPEPVAA